MQAGQCGPAGSLPTSSKRIRNRAQKGSWSPRPDSNRGPFPYQGNALPPELRGRAQPKDTSGRCILGARNLMPLTADELLDRARRLLIRVEPEQAAAEHSHGVLLVDIRPSEQRPQGQIPGPTVTDPNVPHCSLDPPP